MDIITLNQTTFLPDKVIRTYEEFVWTERYVQTGDFKLVVKNDNTVLNLMKLGSFVSHSDTREVMIVENHEIERKDGDIYITISGRSYEAFMENRFTALKNPNPLNPFTASPTKDSSGNDAVLAFNYGNTNVPGWLPNNLIQLFMVTGYLNPGSVVANFDSSYDVGPAVYLEPTIIVDRKPLYDSVVELLNISQYGLKNIRPLVSGTDLIMQIIDGTDLSATVVFSVDKEDFTEIKYFRSIAKYRNIAYVISNNYSVIVNDASITGEFPPPPELQNRHVLVVVTEDLVGAGYDLVEEANILRQRGYEALGKLKKTDLIQCKVSPFAGPKFKQHYDVGDIVTVNGDFGIVKKMRVTEYILTSDKNGTSGYPGLTAM